MGRVLASEEERANRNVESGNLDLADWDRPTYEGVVFANPQEKEGQARSGRCSRGLALTGFAGLDDKSKAIAAGYQRPISKPVDLGSLTSEILRLVQKERP